VVCVVVRCLRCRVRCMWYDVAGVVCVACSLSVAWVRCRLVCVVCAEFVVLYA
jgi:hypothetical protein